MSRISSYFQALQGKKALIPFMTAGDPEPAMTVSLMHGLVDGGADIIELGVPFSDPMADGPIIQRASERALRHNVTLSDVLMMVQRFRQDNKVTPIVLMGYLNPFAHMGYTEFAKRAAEAGVDGVLTVDCPPEASSDWLDALNAVDIAPIFLVAPTTSDARVAKIARYAKGYLYYVSLKGVTGADHLDLEQVTRRVAALRSLISIPIAVGFGVRDAATARALSSVADAVIVGSRLVQEIETAPSEDVKEAVTRLVAELKMAIRSF